MIVESMISPEERSLPFGVEADVRPDPRKSEFCKVFASRVEAVDTFNRLKIRFKWLCEIGLIDLGNGRKKETWVYYYWSPDNPEYGDPPPPGKGLDIDDMTRFYDYEPINK